MKTSVVKLIHYDKTKSEDNMEELHSADIPSVYQEDVIREDDLKEKK